MTKHILKTFFLLFFLSTILLCKNQAHPAQSADVPVIHVHESNHIFPTVFEGEILSHTFKVFNKGTANLNIKNVTPS